MAKEFVEKWMPSNLVELREAVNEMFSEAEARGIDPYTVNIDVRDMILKQDTLTDNSTVLDIFIRENK